jgi:SRSO17 transposase
MVHRTKPQIALELYDRAKSNGIVFEWLTFDELYGHNREFLKGLRQRRQKYVAEVPVTFTGWVQSPRVTHRTYRRCAYRGRVRKTPRCVQGTPHPHSVREHLQASPELRDQAWQKFRIKDGEKGPQVWEVKQLWFYPQDGRGLPQEPVHLIVARNVFEPKQIKYFVAHAPRETPLTVLLCVAFTRWRVERCFEDQKTELGFDHFEGRSYIGLMRHQIITAVTHLFLSRVHLQWREKKSGADRLPGTDRFFRAGSIVVSHRQSHPSTPDAGRPNHQRHTRPQDPRSIEPSQTNPAAITCPTNQADRTSEVRVGKKLAL